MQLSTVRDFLAPFIAKATTLPADLKAQAISIDAEATLEKVQNFVEMILDSASLAETIIGGTFAFSAIFYIQSYVSTFAAVFSPFTLISALVSGTLLYDSYQTYQAVKELHEWTQKQDADSFDIDSEEVTKRWTTFCNTLKYNTTFIEPLLRPYLDIVSKREA
ncbi:hypothetical protein [Simkania negevensis]|uniref:Uncharacterized protein n=1 Tax=Simkania negevensis (strain ATCC VR-1471 / DSM 27360 / Z) TaxID=331113 RepID=F8L9R7_SIMNZ|nr:hypothetical protein [Simkania negevensis]CCB89611.1 unknown protein [Simkania negevensis Z]